MASPVRPLASSDIQEVVSDVGDLWEGLREAKLLLTGCTGFFGPWLLESLLEANRVHGLRLEAWVLTRDASAFQGRCPHLASHPALHLLEGDVRTFRYPDVPMTHVVHGAASANSARDPQGPQEVRETILKGTERVLALARRDGVRRLLFISSGAVYGTQPPDVEALEESSPGIPPFIPYGQAKLDAEGLCWRHLAEHGLPLTIARCFAFLAPHLPLDAHFAAGNFLGDALQGRSIQVRGDGRAYRSYLYGTDLAWWLWTLLLRGELGHACNVGSGQAVTLGALARAIASPKGLPVTIAQPPGHGPAPRYVPSVRRARETLGLVQKVDLGEAIRRTLAWHAHPSAESP